MCQFGKCLKKQKSLQCCKWRDFLMYNEGIKYFRKVLVEKADLYNFQNVGLPFGKYDVGCKKMCPTVKGWKK